MSPLSGTKVPSFVLAVKTKGGGERWTGSRDVCTAESEWLPHPAFPAGPNFSACSAITLIPSKSKPPNGRTATRRAITVIETTLQMPSGGIVRFDAMQMKKNSQPFVRNRIDASRIM
jgi:hypothetical protein